MALSEHEKVVLEQLEQQFRMEDPKLAEAGWTATVGSSHQAMLCTDEHVFSASLLDVPGSTQTDALNTILAAID